MAAPRASTHERASPRRDKSFATASETTHPFLVFRPADAKLRHRRFHLGLDLLDLLEERFQRPTLFRCERLVCHGAEYTHRCRRAVSWLKTVCKLFNDASYCLL